MATPAQIANDMNAQAVFWTGRDQEVAKCCRDAANVIRDLLDQMPVDDITAHGLISRMLDLESRADGRWGHGQLLMSLRRARNVLIELVVVK